MKRNKINQTPNYKDENIKVLTPDEWRTPQWLFDKVQVEFHLEVDRAATEANAKLPKFLTKENNALNRTWLESGWANIPYSAPKLWYEKARTSAILYETLTVLLVKADTSTKYWMENTQDAHVRFLSGRIKFWDENNTPHYGATFPSALVIFSLATLNNPRYEQWDYRPDMPRKLW